MVQVKENDEGSEEKRGKEKKKRESKARKVVSAWNILCGPTCTYAVGLLTLAIRASIVNAHPNRTLIFHNGTREPSSKAVFLTGRQCACGQAA
jgi:hypothetical protein